MADVNPTTPFTEEIFPVIVKAPVEELFAPTVVALADTLPVIVIEPVEELLIPFTELGVTIKTSPDDVLLTHIPFALAADEDPVISSRPVELIKTIVCALPFPVILPTIAAERVPVHSTIIVALLLCAFTLAVNVTPLAKENLPPFVTDASAPSFHVKVAVAFVTVVAVTEVSTVIVKLLAYTTSLASGAKSAVPFHHGDVVVVSLQFPDLNALTFGMAYSPFERMNF